MGGTASRLIDNIEKVIVGKRNEIMLTVMAYFAEGHVLLEDMPGVAAMLARALSRSIGCEFKRINAPDAAELFLPLGSISIPRPPSSNFAPALCSRRSCSQMKSTAPRRARAGGAARSHGGAKGDRRRQQLRIDAAVSHRHAIRLTMKGHFRCPKRNWTGFLCG